MSQRFHAIGLVAIKHQFENLWKGYCTEKTFICRNKMGRLSSNTKQLFPSQASTEFAGSFEGQSVLCKDKIHLGHDETIFIVTLLGALQLYMFGPGRAIAIVLRIIPTQCQPLFPQRSVFP